MPRIPSLLIGLLALATPAVAQSPVFIADDMGRIALVIEMIGSDYETPPEYFRPPNAAALAATEGLFPGAKGWAGENRWDHCTSQRTWRVTSTGTSGQGTAEAITDSVMKYNSPNVCQFVIFTRGGNFFYVDEAWNTGIQNLTIAGQLASGIVNLRGGRWRIRRASGLRVEHVTSRHTNAMFPYTLDCTEDTYYRHVSSSWFARTGGQNLLQWGCDSHNGLMWGRVTFEHNLAAEPNVHPTAMHMGGDDDYPNHFASKFLVLENVFSGGHRHPLASDVDSMSVVRNISYNSCFRAGETGAGAARVDVLNHYHKAGPCASGNWPWLVHTGPHVPEMSMHIAGVRGPQNNWAENQTYAQNIAGANRILACSTNNNPWCPSNGAQVPSQWLRADTMYVPGLTFEPISDAKRDSILAIAGNSRYVTCSGEWAARRDSVDTRIVAEFYAGTAAYTSVPTAAAPLNREYPAPAGGTPCADTDADGLFDEWEIAQCGSLSCINNQTKYNNRFAIQWLLEGRNLDGTLVGGGEEPDPPPASPRRRFFLREYTCVPGAGFGGGDVCGVNIEGTEYGAFYFTSPARDSAIVITINTDSLTVGPPPLASAELSAVCAAWGCVPSRLETMPIPGESGASIIRAYPGDSVADMVAAAPVGATIVLSPGVYREQSITPKNNQTIQGDAGAVLSGARVLSGPWVAADGRWYIAGQSSVSFEHGSCLPEYPRCGYPQDVWYADSLQVHVASVDDVVPGTWHFDYGNGRVWIGSNPSGVLVELSMTTSAFGGSASGVTIRGLTVEKYANRAQTGAIVGNTTTNWLVENNVVQRNHGVGIRVGDGMVVRNNLALHNGQVGIGGGGTGGLVEGNEIAWNNRAGFAWGWEAGGTKFARTVDLTVRDNHVHHNGGPGLWTDIENYNTLYEFNRVEDNEGPGIFHEISRNARIRYNTVERNGVFGGNSYQGASGILISASGCPNPDSFPDQDATMGSDGRPYCVAVYDNIVLDNAGGISGIQQNRGSGDNGEYRLRGMFVTRNTIRHTSGFTAVGADNGDSTIWDYESHNRYVDNVYEISPTANRWHWITSRDFAGWQSVGNDVGGSAGDGETPDGVVVHRLNSAGLLAALDSVEALGGGNVLLPAGTYDLSDWAEEGVEVNVPIGIIGIDEEPAVLQGDQQLYLFDFGRNARIQGVAFRDWKRPIRFLRAADWGNDGISSDTISVLDSHFEDVAIAIEGRRESGSEVPEGAHQLTLLQVDGNTFLRTRRAVDFRRVLINEFEFTNNTAQDVVHRDPEPDVPLDITALLQMGADLEDSQMRATEVLIKGNDIRNVTNEDAVNGRAYAILAYRGPTIVEDNYIENVTAADGSDDGATAIYQRSRTYARFARNTVVNGSNTPNVAAVFAKHGGAEWEVLDNEIVFTDEYKALHGSTDYKAFESSRANLRFEGNTVRGATRQFVTRMETSNFGNSKIPLVIHDNTFEDCDPIPGGEGRALTIGYRRSVVEITDNEFINCGVRGNEYIFANSTDSFEDTDTVRIAGNTWTFTDDDVRMPARTIFMNAHPRVVIVSGNDIRYQSSDPASASLINWVFVPDVAGAEGAEYRIEDNHLEGFRELTTSATSIVESRSAIDALVVDRNRAVSGGNFVRIQSNPPDTTYIRDNDVTGISGSLLLNSPGGTVVASGNTGP